MTPYIRMLIPAGLMVAAFYLLDLSYEASAKWHAHMAFNDPSGAELYELNFRLTAAPAVALILLSGFLAGRWWR